MKKGNIILFSLFLIALCLQSCDNYKTYAEMLKEEREAISSFISLEKINPISTGDFFDPHGRDTTTNVDNNEYALFKDNGLYLQITNQAPNGRKVQNGDQVIVRFRQIGIISKDTLSSFELAGFFDEFLFTKSNYSVTAKFMAEDDIYGLMASTYGTSVPTGWLVPLEHIKIGRSTKEEELARVKIIVPSKIGHSTAINQVYPYFYELTYQLSR